MTVKKLKNLNGLTSDVIQPGQRLQLASSPAPEPTAPKTYVVKSGDTLTRIASQFRTTVKRLKKLNGLTSDNIRIGDRLKLP